jgi:glycosyltransferase involved in cell wall biosynthesis
VSVIVPAFERVGPLLELLRSLRDQRLDSGSFEIIVSDDGSGPEVEAAVRRVASAEGSPVVFVRGPNAGPGVARNLGVAAATAPMVAFTDSDCLASPGWLQALVSALESGATVVHGKVESALPALEPFVHSIQDHGAFSCAANFALLRRAFDQVGGFRSEVSRVAEDHDLVGRLRASGHRPRYVPTAVVTHPPRLKRIRLSPFLAASGIAMLRDLEAFYRLVPERRGDLLRVNRRLALRAVAKLALLLAPLGLPPPGWLLGPAAFAGWIGAKWLRTNRQLASAGEAWRVPAVEAAKYVLLAPFIEVLDLTHRARFGLLRF